ncbi:nucleoside/nucleotide kinase family protein [Levilactobacillus huananensis]|uniref:adenylylsulfate kinase n=1 Tax=Levilactobacillus huananensis TaxID=2486019 RepID=UPI000F783DDD|nr:adenylylsulfate kinase [Levilactobacillus huananensis]
MTGKVIVISGVMAGGKTTLIKALSRVLPDNRVVSFDDYSIDALSSAPSLQVPIERAVNQYDISALLADLKPLLHRYAYILVDFPFGRRHNDLTPYIDWSFYLKTPLDIAFARQLVRDYSNQPTSAIIDWAKTYLTNARPIFTHFDHYISASADLIIDGQRPLPEKVAVVLKALKINQ